MNFHRLRYFRAAAEFGSLRKAAKVLDISQPSLTRQIQILEHEFKTPLFARDSKRLTITPAGTLLASRIGFILDEIESIQRDIAKLSDDRRTNMRIGAIQSTCDILVPHAIRALRARYPSVQIAVHGIRSSEIIELVGRQFLDIGIVAAPVSDPRLVQTPLARDVFRMISSRRHRYGAMTRLSLAQLEGEPFVTFPKGFALRDLVESAFNDCGLELNVVVELESIEAIKELVREGGGISLLPGSTLIGEKNRRDLTNTVIEDPQLVRDIVAIRHAGDQLSRPVAFLQDALRSALQAAGDLPPSTGPAADSNRLIAGGHGG
jgi:DNA-binding transcriptional LysR family regulator